MKALLVVDMQMEMQRRIDAGKDCVNPDAPPRIAALCAAFRKRGWPVVHIRHGDEDPTSPFHPGAAGYAPMACGVEMAEEPVFVKRTSSAFASTDLAGWLRGRGLREVVVVGAVAGFCINSTVRAGADLGFRMAVVRDAVIGFGLPGLSARVIFDVTMAHLAADFAAMTEAETAISAVQADGRA